MRPDDVAEGFRRGTAKLVTAALAWRGIAGTPQKSAWPPGTELRWAGDGVVTTICALWPLQLSLLLRLGAGMAQRAPAWLPRSGGVVITLVGGWQAAMNHTAAADVLTAGSGSRPARLQAVSFGLARRGIPMAAGDAPGGLRAVSLCTDALREPLPDGGIMPRCSPFPEAAGRFEDGDVGSHRTCTKGGDMLAFGTRQALGWRLLRRHRIGRTSTYLASSYI
ncbi:unnamed protein product [Prorocentrum cordatum]|uniref:Uncharacterized protein n=1 Tax=Prorocentrum cordatum TaxID=2364126 RepID=A0ABN9QI19_9DINO|nr:unnamed protein product [Polarella glacialis]